MLTEEEYSYFQSQRHYFIENGTKASNFQWLFSKGTNFTCYLEFMEERKYISDEQSIDNMLYKIRVISSALGKPFNMLFFYFTLVVCILHKFNFKNPIIKIIIIHYIFRSTGDVLDSIGSLITNYFANRAIKDAEGNILGYECITDVIRYEMSPLRWFITRHLATIFWYIGEIVADWYPLIRTKLLVKGEKSMILLYISCGIFNLTKLILIGYYLSLGPSKLYDSHGVLNEELLNIFYDRYWLIQLLILYTSVLYDITVFMVLRKKLNEINYSNHSFLSKFRTISEFRIIVSVGVSIIFLPIISITFFLNLYYNRKKDYNLGYSFEDIRILIANAQYYMIFIDQILLILTKEPDPGSMDVKKLNLYIMKNSMDSKMSFDSKMIDYQYGIECDLKQFIRNEENMKKKYGVDNKNSKYDNNNGNINNDNDNNNSKIFKYDDNIK